MILLEIIPLSKPVAISEMLILLIVAAFIGWLIGRWINNGRISTLRESLAASQAELDTCRKKSINLTSKNTVAPVASKAIVADNLKVIEGIGPKIEQLLNDNGILTLAQLANAGSETLNKILQSGGVRFAQIHDTTTWSDQAALARDNKWEELGRLQDKLDGGRIV